MRFANRPKGIFLSTQPEQRLRRFLYAGGRILFTLIDVLIVDSYAQILCIVPRSELSYHKT